MLNPHEYEDYLRQAEIRLHKFTGCTNWNRMNEMPCEMDDRISSSFRDLQVDPDHGIYPVDVAIDARSLGHLKSLAAISEVPSADLSRLHR